MADAAPLRMIVCTGSSCRKADGYREVLDLAHGIAQSRSCACQDICSGPVVGLVRGDGRVRWYRRLRGKRLRTLALVVRSAAPRRALKDREVRRRRGRMRHEAKVQPLR